MKTRNIIIGLIILCVVSCVPKRAENEGRLVRINSYNHNKEIYETDTTYLHKEIKNDTVKFIYKKEDITNISICKPIYNDSLILIYNHKCPLVDNKTFVINNREYTVFTYYNDAYIDAEYSIFYNSEYGILGTFREIRRTLLTSWEYDTISKVLIDSIINNLSNFKSIPPPELKDSILLKMKKNKRHN